MFDPQSMADLIGANSTAIRIDGHRGSAFIGALRLHASGRAPAFDGAVPRTIANQPARRPTTLLP